MRTLLIVAWVLVFSATSRGQDASIHIAADPWCPYNCAPDSKFEGVMIELAKEALSMSGYVLHYQTMNWARAKLRVQAGELDGVVGMAYTEKSKHLYYFPKTPLGESQICFYKRAIDEWQYQGVASLDAKVFGWINEYGFVPDPLDDWVKENKNTKRVITVAGKDTHARLFKLLTLKRIDTFAEDKTVIAHELNLLGLNESIKVAGCLNRVEKVFIAFSLESQHSKTWADALDAGLVRLKESGRYNKILEKYGLNHSGWNDSSTEH